MIRDYRETDFMSCLNLVNKVWEFDKHFAPPAMSDLSLRIFTGMCLSGSSFLKIIEEDDRVAGLIFGKIENQRLYKKRFSVIWNLFKSLGELLFLRGVSFRKKLFYLKCARIHERNRRKIDARKGCEVNLFVVDPDYQGRGFGKTLIKAFISSCKENQVTRIVLETDRDCNYGFYDHMGFQRKGSFYSPLQDEFSDKGGESFVYELLI